MFDPEKVERWEEPVAYNMCVLASDYDKLLAQRNDLLTALIAVEDRIKQCFNDVPEYVQYGAVLADRVIRNAGGK